MSSAAFGLGDEENPEKGIELRERVEAQFGDRQKFKSFLVVEANKRDDILYATKTGLPDPKWDAPDYQFLKQCKLNAAVAIGVACVILQDSKKSPIIEQILFSLVGHLELDDREKELVIPPDL